MLIRDRRQLTNRLCCLIEPSTERGMGRLSRKMVCCGCAMLAALLLTDCVVSALYWTPITY